LVAEIDQMTNESVYEISGTVFYTKLTRVDEKIVISFRKYECYIVLIKLLSKEG